MQAGDTGHLAKGQGDELGFGGQRAHMLIGFVLFDQRVEGRPRKACEDAVYGCIPVRYHTVQPLPGFAALRSDRVESISLDCTRYFSRTAVADARVRRLIDKPRERQWLPRLVSNPQYSLCISDVSRLPKRVNSASKNNGMLPVGP